MISISFDILRDFIEEHPKFVADDLQSDLDLINFFLEAINIGSEVHDQFFGNVNNNKYLFDWNFNGGSVDFTFRDEKSRERIKIGQIIVSFKNIKLKSSIFSFYLYQKEICCPHCETWITCSEMNMTKIFGKNVVLHHDDKINKDIFFTENPLISTRFKEDKMIEKITPENYTQEQLIILEAFHMIINNEKDITHFFQIRESQFNIKNTEVYLMIKDHKPIGFAYWNDATPKEGIIDCIRQLYILEDYRNRGYARELLKEKIDSIERFIAESPNEISSHIIEKYFKEKYMGAIITM